MSKKELKTLKDFKPPKVQADRMYGAHQWMMFEFYYEQAKKDLREEARKWIDALESVKNDTYKYYDEDGNRIEPDILEFYDSEYDDYHYVGKWIRHFFNLNGEEE